MGDAFTNAQAGFQTALTEDPSAQGKVLVPTEHFIQVCALTAEIYQALFISALASQLKGDIDNSANNLLKSYKLFPADRATLDALIGHEIKTRGYDAVRADRESGTVGLLWAKRSIDFVVMYLDLLSTRPDLDAGSCAQQTYDKVLAPYHGWLTSTFVSTVMGFAPAREDVYAKLGLDKLPDANAAAREFVVHAKRTMGQVQRVFDSHKADFPDKV